MKPSIVKYAAHLEFDKICAKVGAMTVCEDACTAVLQTEPTTVLSEAQSLLDVTELLHTKISRNALPAISPVSHIAEIVTKAQKGGTLSMGELLNIRVLLYNAHVLHAWYGKNTDDDTHDAYHLFENLFEEPHLEQAIFHSILSDTEMDDSASPELRSLRRQIAHAENGIRDKLNGMIRAASTQKFLQDAIITIRGGRFVLPVKQEYKSSVPGLLHDVSSSGSTLFIEPAAIVEANNRTTQLKADEAREIERILARFSGMVGEVADPLIRSYDALISIDVALAKAKYAVSLSAVKPQLNTQGRISLQKARHPLIAKDTVVPIDIVLGESYNILVITGPNTGGKTVALKTIGLLSLMAMSGMLIPASEHSKIGVFEQILVDIGDEQSIEQSLSTFSAHIKNIADILKNTDDRSLVLIDELGAGTDPAEGAGLAIAILDRLRACESRVAATTHYGEIKLYAIKTEGVQNANCEFNVKTLQPTYRISIGTPGRSNALLIGEKLGLDSSLIESARNNMSSDARRFEDVIGDIEQLKSELHRKEELIRQQEEQADTLVRRANEEYLQLVSKGEHSLDDAMRKARQLEADVTATAQKLLDEIKQIDHGKEKNPQTARQQARAIANYDFAKALHPVSERKGEMELAPPLYSARQGDSVYVVPIGKHGIVLRDSDEKGYVEIQAGSIKTRVHLHDLREGNLQINPAPKITHRFDPSTTPPARTVGNELNIMGKTVDEGVAETDQFIDAAVLSKLHFVHLIHGKGTGALRAGLHVHLKANKHVRNFRLASYGEGDSGVTVVELK